MWAARQTLGAALRAQAPQCFAQRAPAQRLAAALAPTLRFASGGAPVPPDGADGPHPPTRDPHLELLRRRDTLTAEQKEVRNFLAIVKTISPEELLPKGDAPLLERFTATLRAKLVDRQEALDWLSRVGGLSSEGLDWLQSASTSSLLHSTKTASVTKSIQEKQDWLGRVDGMSSAELEEQAAKRGTDAIFLKMVRTPAKKGPTQAKLDWLKRLEGMSREELEEEVTKLDDEVMKLRSQAALDEFILRASRRKSKDKPEDPPGSA
jgi:ribosomal protein L29